MGRYVRMNIKLKEKINEAFTSVLPVSVIVLLLDVLFVRMSLGAFIMFVVGVFFLIIGMGIFSLGAEMAMMPIGEGVGAQFAKSRKLPLIVALCFFLGFIITVAEPDLKVLAGQVPSIPDMTIIVTVAVGVAIFLVLALLRVLFKVGLSFILVAAYGAMFALSALVPSKFISVAFDSGGVTTGPITVPFILAVGIGLASVRGDKNSHEDSFGFVAICSVGPILAVMLLGILHNPEDAAHKPVIVPKVENMYDVFEQFRAATPMYLFDVLLALVPIIVFFGVFQLATKRYTKRQLIRISIGLAYTIFGLVLFLTGVEVGFIPAGNLLGRELADKSHKWLLIPIGLLVGYFIVSAEPAVHVLVDQVEEISGGAIPKKAMNLCLSLGIAASVGISMIRALTGISIFWFLIPGYAVSLALTFFVPKIFVGIAFDSGGVASGPMTSTFLLPFVIGACETAGGDVMADAFGIVAMVAMTPLIAIQLMGYFYKSRITGGGEEQPEQVIDELTEFDAIEGRR